MGTVLCSLIAFIIYFFTSVNSTEWSRGEYWIGFVVFVVGAFVSIIIGFGIARFLSLFFSISLEKVEEKSGELGGLERESSLTGSFFLGCGNIGTERRYFFYRKKGKGYVPESVIVSDKVSFFEQEKPEDKPCLQVYRKEMKSGWGQFFAISSLEEEHRFYIPKGSIKTDYKL
jgi:hypothetical protein